MSGFGPTGGDDPFGGLPFFGDLGKLFGGMGGGGLQWDTARQMAMQVASQGQSEPNIDPIARMDVEQMARVAELQVAQATGLSTSMTGRAVTVVPVTRVQWVQRSLDAFKPLFESLAGALGPAEGAANPLAGFDPTAPMPSDGTDPMSAMLGQLMGALAPMLLSVTAGGMIGHLAGRSFGQYDLPIPRDPSDELLLVLPTVDAFADDWSIDRKDLLLWLCIHEVTHHAILGVPHLRAELERLLREYASGFSPDASALVDKLESVDLSDPSKLGDLQSVLGDPEMILGAMQTDAQRELKVRLESVIAVVVGTVDHVMDQIGDTLLPSSYSMITEALRRRRVESDESDRFVARLFGLELGQTTYDRGAAFVDGVVERAGFAGLDPLWRDVAALPTPAELDAPGLWLARLELD